MNIYEYSHTAGLAKNGEILCTLSHRNHWELAQTKTDGTCSRAPPGPYSRTKLTRLFAPIFFFRSAENIALRNFFLEPRDGAAENMPKTFFSEPWALSGAVQECPPCSAALLLPIFTANSVLDY